MTDEIDPRKLPLVKFDDVAWTHAPVRFYPKAESTELSRQKDEWVFFEGAHYSKTMDVQVTRYGGRSGMRVVDSREEALRIAFADDEKFILPTLFVLSMRTYREMMSERDYMSFINWDARTLYGIPFQTNRYIPC